MNTVLSNNLKRLRQQKKLTQEQVAEVLRVSSHTVSRWECNTTLPDVIQLPEIARLYCVTIDDLFKESSVAYENLAQRLATSFEFSRDPEDFIRADLEFKKLIKNGEMTPNDMRTYGIIHQFMMNYCKDKAFLWYDKVLKQDSKQDELVYQKTRAQKMTLLAQLGRADESIAQQHTMVEKDETNPNEWCLLVAAYMYAGRYKEAYDWFLKAVAKFPNEWELYIRGGDICKQLKRYDEAFTLWDKAEALGTKYLDGKYSKAFYYEEMHEYKKAYDVWCEIVEELKKGGFEIEAEAEEKRAKACFEKMHK